MKISSVCVIGGTGLIGRHVVQRSRRRGVFVRVPTRRRERVKKS
jgi:uncharacterized protein YbjT (DUF2867 family)